MQYKDFPPLFRLFHLFSILRNKRTTKQEKVFSGFPDDTGTASNQMFSDPKNECTPVSSVITFVNVLILSPFNSLNSIFVKDLMTGQIVDFLNN